MLKNIFIIILLCGCCGYTTRSILPSNIKSIAIPIAKNETVRPGLGELLTDSLIADFTQDRTLKIDNIDRADIILDCTIKNYERSPQAYTANQEVIAYKVLLECEITASDRVKTDTLWHGNIATTISYDAKTETEDQGIEKAITKLSLEILRRVLTTW